MLHGSNKHANQHEFPDLRIRDRQFGPRYESGRGAKAKQPDRHHRTGNRPLGPSPAPEAKHSTQHLPDSQRNPRDQRRTHNRHSHRLRRYAAEQELESQKAPGFSLLKVQHTLSENTIKQPRKKTSFGEASHL